MPGSIENAIADEAIARVVMGRGAVRARSDDAELHFLVTFLEQERAEIAADVLLAPPAETDIAHQAFKGAIRGGAGVTERGELDLVLAHAERTEHLGRGRETGAGERAGERQHESR